MNADTKDALETWLKPSTWHTNHPLDEGRFYDFVFAAWTEKQGLWDEAYTREVITKTCLQWQPNHNKEDRARVIDNAMSKGTTILDFLCQMKDIGRTLK